MSTHDNPTTPSLRRRLICALLPLCFGFASVFGLGCFDSCVPPFPPGYHIDKFRIIAIKAEPPELGPGDRTQMSFLALDDKGLIVGSKVFPPSQCFSSDGLADPSAVWLACLPGVGPAASEGGCTDFSSIIGGSGGDGGQPMLPDGGSQQIQILLPPCGPSPSWTAPSDYLADLPADEQLKGAEAVIVLATTREKQQQISLKRVRISTKPNDQRNTNPRLTKILLDDKEVPSCRPDNADKCQAVVVPFNKTFKLKAEIDPASQDSLPPNKDGKVQKEDITIEWYSTAGEFSPRRNVVSGETPPNDSPLPEWSPTNYIGKPLAQGLELQIVAVALDSRGGFDWLIIKVILGAP